MENTIENNRRILSLIHWGIGQLSQSGFSSPRLIVELLLCHALGCKRVDLHMNYDQIVSSDCLEIFKSLLNRKLNREPLDYILGETEFMGYNFIVDTRVMTPRSETEVLIEQVLQLIGREGAGKRLLDVGTGCGNIAISLVKFINGLHIDAVDVSLDALEVARQNVEKHQVGENVNLIHCDILKDYEILKSKKYDIIVSNPPYISEDEFLTLQPEVRIYEPKIATSDGADGLTFYRILAKLGIDLLLVNGWLCVEIGYNQAKDVYDIFNKNGYQNITCTHDYCSVDRVIKAQWVKQ